MVPIPAADSGHTILLADDSEDSVFAIRHLLEAAGHAVVTAASVREALDVLDEIPQVALVISAVRVPGADGFDLHRVLRHRFPALPVILMTDLPVGGDDVAPADATVLAKPIDLAALGKLVAARLAPRPAVA